MLRDALGADEFGRGGDTAEIRVTDPDAYLDLALGGALGAAEAYMQGKWSSPDLVRVVRYWLANREYLGRFDAGLPLSRPAGALARWYRRNTRGRARENIRAHYDLGDELFRLFLDPTLSYSSAVFPRESASLDEAALHKLELVCQRLDLGPDDHLLEIGTGWGGLALHAARSRGCRVTTTTISRNQYEYASRLVREQGLGDRIEVLFRDYRDLDGRYDKLVSIEMIEAVGHDYLDEYFRVCAARLKPRGRMLLQAIVIADRFYDRHRRNVDFIGKYIFPGGALPSIGSISASVAAVTDLQLVQLDDIGSHYARTLREWRNRFLERLPEVRELGYPEEFIRMWEYYLCYCEGAFAERAISDVHMVFDKPR